MTLYLMSQPVQLGGVTVTVTLDGWGAYAGHRLRWRLSAKALTEVTVTAYRLSPTTFVTISAVHSHPT